MESVKMAKCIPGYEQNIACGANRNLPFITQHNCLVSCNSKEISFYNDSHSTVFAGSRTLIAIWYVKGTPSPYNLLINPL